MRTEFKDVAGFYIGSKVMYLDICYSLAAVGPGSLVDLDSDQGNGYFGSTVKECKPILYPLSAMTKEQAHEVARICGALGQFRINGVSMGYKHKEGDIHESVKCFVVESFCAHPAIMEWRKSSMVQIDDEDCSVIFGKFYGDALKDDMITSPFELTRYLCSQHFNVFGLEADQFIDPASLPTDPYKS